MLSLVSRNSDSKYSPLLSESAIQAIQDLKVDSNGSSAAPSSVPVPVPPIKQNVNLEAPFRLSELKVKVPQLKFDGTAESIVRALAFTTRFNHPSRAVMKLLSFGPSTRYPGRTRLYIRCEEENFRALQDIYQISADKLGFKGPEREKYILKLILLGTCSSSTLVLLRLMKGRFTKACILNGFVTKKYEKLEIEYDDGYSAEAENNNSEKHQIVAWKDADGQWWSADTSAAQYDLFDCHDGLYYRLEKMEVGPSGLLKNSYFQEETRRYVPETPSTMDFFNFNNLQNFASADSDEELVKKVLKF